MNATVIDLRKNMKNILAALDRNEKVNLTYRGRRKAVIVPYDDREDVTASSHPAFGLWADRKDTEDVDSFVRELRRGRTF